MASSPSAALAQRFRPQQYRSCAVVGSGHDLRCGTPRGEEIDAHAAVFRSNTAQPATDADMELRGPPQPSSSSSSTTTSPTRSSLQRQHEQSSKNHQAELARYSIGASRGGRRTS